MHGQVYGGKVAAPIFKELADKIYSSDLDLHKPIKANSVSLDLPIVKSGNYYDANLVLEKLGMTFNTLKSNYFIAKTSSTSILLTENNIIDSLKENKMPNLIGMNLSDALHLLYQFGFSTEVNGYGKIIYCLDASDKKINVGQKITKGSLIKIQLG